jgi:ADP-dependent phosphofructokinase/glucokinase
MGHNVINRLIFVPAAASNNKIQVAASWEIQFDEILGLANGIVSSVYKTHAYLEMLEKDKNIQDHFENAIEDIHAKLDVRSLFDGAMMMTQNILFF